jgi:NAD(P) transhydrogenase subunit alpha
MLSHMRTGSVIVDMATEMGGNCEGSVLDQVVTVHGVQIIGYGNLPARLPTEASNLFARNVLSLLNLVYNNTDGLTLNMEDEILKGSILTHQSQIVHPHFIKAA